MKIIRGVCLLLLISCNADMPENKTGNVIIPKQSPFVIYLKKQHRVTDCNTPAYYLLVSSKQCKLCVKGNLDRLDKIKPKLRYDNLHVISDYAPGDTILNGINYSAFLADSTAQFMFYDFPKSYVTIYKIQGDSVAAYASLEDESGFEAFLSKEFPAK